MPKPATILEYTCKEVLVHGITGKKRVCGKVIRSFYPGQFEFWKLEHLAKHKAEKEGISTQEALAQVRTETK